MADFASIRNEYSIDALRRSELNPDPIKQLQYWFKEALESDQVEPTAMILSTVGEDQKPQNRTVLFKGIENNKIRFFTNYESRKAKALENNPNVALLLPWYSLQRQVAIEGSVTKLTKNESASYFATRPKESQYGAWASKQSSPIDSRDALKECFETIRNKYPEDVPMPEHWGGYEITPTRFEFWQGREKRLHDRFEYASMESNWTIQRLCP